MALICEWRYAQLRSRSVPDTFTAFTSDKCLAAVFTGSPRPLNGDVSVQTFLANQAIAFAGVGEPVLAGDYSDVLVHVAAWLATPL